MLKLTTPLVTLIMLTSLYTPHPKTQSKLITTLPCILMLLMFAMTPSLLMTQQNLKPMIAFDYMSGTLSLLTLWISALMILASASTFHSQDRVKSFSSLIIILSQILLIAFNTSNLFSFFIFFEASLIPTLLLIIGWGYQPERLQAGMYLMLYTITASLPLLIMIASLHLNNHHTSFMLPSPLLNFMQWNPTIFGVLVIAAFLVKMPLYWTHLWLPKAHVEAPVAGSMILAGLLLKLGSYGILRMTSMIPKISPATSKMITSLSLIGAILTSLICIRQSDIKSLIAYSSVGHMALMIAGMMTMSKWGWEGALVMMIAHGLCSSALFFLSYSTYTTTNTRNLTLTKGMLTMFPSLTLFWFLFSACNMAAPPSINLAGEIMLITSIMSFSHLLTPLILMIMSFLAAAYSLFLYTSTNHGYSPLYSNTLNHFSSNNILVVFLHFIPLLMLVSSFPFLTTWTP